MFRLLKKKKVAGPLAVVTGLAVAAGAFAYFTSSGSGTTTASVGSPSNWTVSPSAATGGPLFPGSGTETVPFTVTNPSAGHQQLGNTEAFVNSSNGNVTQGGTPVSGCLASWFTATNSPPASLPSDLAGGGTASGSVGLTMQNMATSQNACQGVSPDVSIQVPVDGVFSNYAASGGSHPGSITAGPDGALWFTDSGIIERISTSGVVTSFGNQGACGITTGPDGALWFTTCGGNSVGRITTGGAVTSFTAASMSYPNSITAGPDGALWFTNNAGNSIGRITTSGSVTSYAVPHAPSAITVGSDGALWFGDNSNIGRVTTAGAVTTYGSGLSPAVIVAGPDGALWFTNQGLNSIGRITTGGTVTTYTAGSVNSPIGITVGPDGALWFINANGGNSVGRITTSGTISNYTSGTISNPQLIAAGADGALWFTNYNSNTVGRITP